MKVMTIAALAPVALLGGVVAGQEYRPPAPAVVVPAPPARPIAPSAGDNPPRQQLVRWRPGTATCAGGAVQTLQVPDPAMTATYAWRGGAISNTATFRFRIAADGRPLGIERAAKNYVAGSEDLAPALAAARFSPGAQRGCSITFTIDRTDFAEAAVNDVLAFTVFPSGTVPREAWRRVQPADSTCFSPAPAVLLRAFPDFKTLPTQAGRRQWSMTEFDTSAAGKPVHVRTIGGSGSMALDAAARRAVAGSRFERGARHGCRYPYWQGGGILPAPEMPSEHAFRPAGATCPETLPYVRQPRLVYPQPYLRRRIEGWAIVAFDVAPWGATGNLRVLATEPTAEFGDAALNVVRNATKRTSNTGYVGCVDRVRFRIGDRPALIVGDEPVIPTD